MFYKIKMRHNTNTITSFRDHNTNTRGGMKKFLTFKKRKKTCVHIKKNEERERGCKPIVINILSRQQFILSPMELRSIIVRTSFTFRF